MPGSSFRQHASAQVCQIYERYDHPGKIWSQKHLPLLLKSGVKQLGMKYMKQTLQYFFNKYQYNVNVTDWYSQKS